MTLVRYPKLFVPLIPLKEVYPTFHHVRFNMIIFYWVLRSNLYSGTGITKNAGDGIVVFFCFFFLELVEMDSSDR